MANLRRAQAEAVRAEATIQRAEALLKRLETGWRLDADEGGRLANEREAKPTRAIGLPTNEIELLLIVIGSPISASSSLTSVRLPWTVENLH